MGFCLWGSVTYQLSLHRSVIVLSKIDENRCKQTVASLP